MRVISIFFLLLVFVRCKKNEDQVVPQFKPAYTVIDSFYLKAKLNGTEVFWIVPSHKNDSSFIYHAGASNGYSDFSNNCFKGYCYYLTAFTQIFKNVAAVQPQMNVGFNMAASSRSSDLEQSWFDPGTKTFQTSVRDGAQSDLLNPAKNGLIVYYIDQDGKSWSSNRGSQQGSNFESVSLTDEIRTDVTAQKVWVATFSCTLYDDSGNSIKVENGEICGPVLLP